MILHYQAEAFIFFRTTLRESKQHLKTLKFLSIITFTYDRIIAKKLININHISIVYLDSFIDSLC